MCEELAGRDSAFAALTVDDNDRFQRDHTSRQFGSGVGVGQAAADRALVADRGMRDMANGLRQQRRVRGNFG